MIIMADDKPVKEVKEDTPAEDKPVKDTPKEAAPTEAPVEEKVESTPAEEPTPEIAPEPVEEKAPEPVEEKVEEKAEEKSAEPVVEKPAPEPKKEEAPKKEAPKEVAPTETPAEEKAPEPKEEPKAEPEAKPKPAKDKAQEKAPEAKPKTEEAPKEEKPVEKPAEEKPAKPQPKVIGIPPDKLLLFDKYDLSEIVVTDAGLARYINLDPVMVPHTGARHANRPFAKSKMNIVERLVNGMMRTEDYTGKKTKTYRVVMATFSIIESKTKKNPVQVLIEALEKAAPREEVTRLRYGGVSVPKAVDVSSSRRLDVALRNICKGAVKATYKNSKSIEICLSNEIMLAAKGDMNSAAISKKDEVERIAGSAR